MTDKIRLVRGDTRPALICTITDETTGGPIGLTGTTTSLKFRLAGATELTGTLIGVVTDGPNGVVQFNWSDDPTILDGPAGDYEGEIQIEFPDETIQTVYDLLKFKLREDL
jgi:hypothetical protein